MAFEFKKLSDVNVIEAMKDGLNVLVEDGGEIVKLAANSMIPEDVALKSDIPEDIALKSDIPDAIPVPMTAEVGQVVAVKAVDENGKPTEWEAVAVGGGSDGGAKIVKYYSSNAYLYHDKACTQKVTAQDVEQNGDGTIFFVDSELVAKFDLHRDGYYVFYTVSSLAEGIVAGVGGYAAGSTAEWDAPEIG